MIRGMRLKEVQDLDRYLKSFRGPGRDGRDMHVFDSQVKKLLQRLLPPPGTCRYCRCTERRACLLTREGHTCGWIDATKTVCSNPRCVDLYKKDAQ